MRNGDAIKLMTDYGSLKRIIFDLDGQENLDAFMESLPFFPDEWHVIDNWVNDLDPEHTRKYFYIVIERNASSSKTRDVVFERTNPLKNYWGL